ncbi:hypothetical protein [Acaryochloris marina]|nr:hypothetical protein [Acaryochloris marina]
MGICYEFAMDCSIKNTVSQEIGNTLRYMPRSEEYTFETPRIDHPLFQDTLHWIPWRTILNNYPVAGEQYPPGHFGSTFHNNQLTVRRLSSDDEFSNVWYLLFPWLASISNSDGFIGFFRSDLDKLPTLLSFLNGKVHLYKLVRLWAPEPSKAKAYEDTMSLEMNELCPCIKHELLRRAETLEITVNKFLSSIIAKKVAESGIDF